MRCRRREVPHGTPTPKSWRSCGQGGRRPSPPSCEELSTTTTWNPSTAKTLVRRLVQKGVVEVSGTRRSYRYSPLFSRQECLRAETRSFLDRMYGGTLKPMLVAFVRDEDLSPDDLDELRRVLEGRD